MPIGHRHDEAPPAVVSAPEAFKKQLDGVLDQVLSIGDALAGDNRDAALAGVSKAQQALAAVDMSMLTGDAHPRWMESLSALNQPLDKMKTGKDIEALRVAFAALSSAMTRAAKMFGPLRSEPLYGIHCPMAFDNRGADWLQKDKAVRNPYFGKAMLTCGEVIETIPPEGGPAHE